MDPRQYALLVAAVSLGSGCAALGRSVHGTDPLLYPEPPADAITFWGHACAYIDVDGFGIVTDPVFAARYAVIRRRVIPSPPPEAYDQSRVVLISHAHHDHLDPATLARFPKGIVILAPAPAAAYLRKHGIAARVMRPGAEFPIPGGVIVAVAALHPGGRNSLKARSDGRALGYVIETPRCTIYYSGDTEYFPGLAEVGTRYKPDVALLNVNPHLSPTDAIMATVDLGMPRMLPIHRGAYDVRTRRLEREWIGEMSAALGPALVPLEVGESYALPRADAVAGATP
jgi:L-ascorbate metabolism protein UlaG (beta-lactamase superfamily)